jgi:DNA polymerase-3 subunit alpha
MAFIHLHTHSHYSLLQALPKIPELVNAAVRAEMTALALTDNGNLYGAIDFYKECKKEGIKPIIGVDAYVAARSRLDKESGIDGSNSRLVLLALDSTGYQNLLKLVTDSYLEGFYHKPRIDLELMRKHKGGLIAIVPSSRSTILPKLQKNNFDGAKEILDQYKDIFGDKNVFLELTHHPEIEGHEASMKKVAKLSDDTGVPLVATHDVHYIHKDDRKAHETLVKIQSSADTEEQGGFDTGTPDFSFINQEQALEYFKNIPEAIKNTHKIADRCNLELKLGTWVFPDYKIEDGQNYDHVLRRVTNTGISKRGLKETKELTDRIEYELRIISEKGFSPYFLVVSDLLHFARENGILATTRGSAAGSVVSYLNGITNIDPLEYKLPFERFLNPERPKAPDIDMDFADDRRDEVIEYAKKRYGDDKVAQIGTFGTMMARASVRDVARALGHPYGVGDRIAKLIPFGSQGFPMSITKAMKLVPEIEEMYKKEPDVKEVIDLAKKVEGGARHISVHAAGVVISPTPLTDFVPLQLDPKGGKIITQYDMHAVEDAGLLKFDFLGIKNLSILARSVALTKKLHNVSIDIENIPLDDKKTFEMLSRGETLGLFQLGGGGMTRYLKELEPTTIHHINAMVALYRPGPMESIPSYIERKHNPKKITFLDERMKEILSQSYGVITYQEDVMLIAVHLAGYSWLEVDALRKAMGKKIPAEMEAQKEKLKRGLVENGMSEINAEKLWRRIEPFAAYGFNKAHAASYGKVAYQTAYMKANHSAPYMAALLTADAGDVDKIFEEIVECKRMGIAVLPPDVNESFGDFTVITDEKGVESIRFGLHSIKNFGEGITGAIIEERKKGGKFTSLVNFLERILDRNLNKKSLEALIKCGALDGLEERGAMYENLDSLLSFSKEISQAAEGQDSLFGAVEEGSAGGAKLVLEKTQPASKEDMLTWEKELLGVYVSGHPLDKFKEKLSKQKRNIQNVRDGLREGMGTVISGIVEDSKQILTKGGDTMAFLRIADFSGNIEVVVFPRVFSEYRDFLAPEKCIAIKGRLSGRNGTPSIIAEVVKEL